jgi:hypothetical protein
VIVVDGLDGGFDEPLDSNCKLNYVTFESLSAISLVRVNFRWPFVEPHPRCAL